MFEKMDIIQHSKPFVDKKEAEAIKDVILSQQIAQGEKVKEFEEILSRYLGLRGAVACSSGTSALHLVLKAMEIMEGDEVIIPSYTCIAILNAIRYTGATPIYADIDPTNLNIDPYDIKKRITHRTKAIIVPHMFGSPASIDSIIDFGLPVIEDCAQALGATYKNKKVGTFGYATVLSFYATKVITTGEGGMILSNFHELLNKAMDLREYDNKSDNRLRFNYKMTDIQAQLGIVQMGRINQFLSRRKEIAKQYINQLKDLAIDVPPYNPESIYYRFILKVLSGSADYVIEEMKKRGINCEKPVFIPLHKLLKDNELNLPITEDAFKRCVSIPIYPALKEHQVKQILENSKAVLEETLN